jgi:Short C-terminal domain
MPGLLRGMARTAVVAGTATAVSNRVSRRQAGRWANQQAQEAPEPQYAEPAPAPPAPAAPRGTDTNTKLAQLRELGQLRDSGVLDDAEFELQKSQILNS